MVVAVDKVIVELEARLDQYNAKIAVATRAFDKSMADQAAAAARSQAAVEKGAAGKAAAEGRAAAAAARTAASNARAAQSIAAAKASETAAGLRSAASAERTAAREQAAARGNALAQARVATEKARQALVTARADDIAARAALRATAAAERAAERQAAASRRVAEAAERAAAREQAAARRAADAIARESQRKARAAEDAARRAAEAQIAGSVGSIRSALLATTSAIAGAVGISAIASMTDSYTRFTNQLRVAGLEGQQLATVQEQLFAIAQRQGVPLEGLGALYGRVAQSATELGASQQQLIQFTTGVAAALRVQGGDAASTHGALLQLSQALGGTIVRAEEFNSINEGARPILQAVANGMEQYRGSVARLRADVIQGKVTSQEFFQGFLAGSANLEAQAARANLTISASFTVVTNALSRYLGQTDQANSFSLRFSQAMRLLADNIGTVANALGVIAVVFGARLVAGLVAAMGATFAFQAALLGAATTMEAVAFTATATGAALSRAFGGPIGIAIAGITLAILAFSGATETARLDVERFDREGEDLIAHLAQLAATAHSAAGGIANVGAHAATATGQVRAFAGAVGDAASRLYELAAARAREQAAAFGADQARARAQIADAQGRIASRSQSETSRARFGNLPVYGAAGDNASDQRAINEATARLNAATVGLNSLANAVRGAAVTNGPGRRFLERYTTPEDRGERNVAQQLADAEQNLTVARRTGNRAAIQSAEAVKFEAQTYQRYRSQGFTPAEAERRTSGDVERYQSATSQGNATRDGRSGAAAARSAAARAAAAERDAAGDAARYARMEREAENDIATSRAELAGSADQRLQIELSRLDNERQNRNEELRLQQRQGQLGAGAEGEARRVALQRLNNEKYALQVQALKAQDRERVRQEEQAVDAARLSNATDLQRASGDLAETRQAQRNSALRLLDLSIQEERLGLEGVIASRDATEAQKRIARERLQILGQVSQMQAAGIERQNEGPRARYLRELRNGAADVNTQLEEIQVRGLQALDESAQSAIKSLIGVHGALGDLIADLAMIFIRQQALALFSGGGGGILSALGIGGGGGNGLGKLIGGGASAGGGLGGLGGFFAKGGRPPMGRVSVVGEDGPEFFVPDQPGKIVPMGKAVSYQGGAAMSPGAGSAPIARVQLELSGDVDARIASISGPIAVEVMQRAAPQIVEKAKTETLRSATRPRLNRR